MESEGNPMLSYGVAILSLVSLIGMLRKFQRTKGTNMIFHISFIVASIGTLFLLPEFVQDVIFSPEGVLIIGTLVPIYESIRAVCTIDEADDEAWLQFWLASAVFTHATEWMDTVSDHYPLIHEYWYQTEFFILLWMLLPFTDGSALIFKKITEPYVVPIAESLKAKVEGQIAMILICVNTMHIWMIWFVFMTLDEEAKRFIVVAVGTVYPLAVSILSMTERGQKSYEITFWLTYWSCFSILFLMMDYLENFVGTIAGFYSICLCFTVYLFLPLFNGADVMFRHILVPLSGQQEQLFLRDVERMKISMKKIIPLEAQSAVFAKAAALFGEKSKGKKL